MDSIGGILDGPRARGTFVLRSSMCPPWSLRVEDRAPLTILTVARGSAYVVPDAGAVLRLDEGDVALIRGPEPYAVADDPATPPQVIIAPDQSCSEPDGTEIRGMSDMGIRTWGNDPAGETVLLSGTYQLECEVSSRLLGALPPMLRIDSEELSAPLVDYLEQETVKDDPGQEALLDRLLDLLLITVVRSWFARSDTEAPGWYGAHGDPVVGPVLRLLHNAPERPWTVASLASSAGVSRAALARRFTSLVGEPPMTFLTNWRLTLAADLLREPGNTIDSVARDVGYGSPFALSAAFKRVRGVSPKQHRETVLA